MWHPIGSWRSPNHHQVVLMNWARLRGFELGQEGYLGTAIFVYVNDFGVGFQIEGRGFGTGGFVDRRSVPPMFPFDRFCAASRRRAFRSALAFFEARR
ncbi:MAG: hypothetical protein K2Y20_13920 [Sphingomonas sp.]|nr:hypothetical protein [Sphingomonas sp.]